jgi:hypothetical protein
MMLRHPSSAKRRPQLMFAITNKIRTIIAVGVVGAALASSGVASADTLTVQPATTTVAASATTATATEYSLLRVVVVMFKSALPLTP